LAQYRHRRVRLIYPAAVTTRIRSKKNGVSRPRTPRRLYGRALQNPAQTYHTAEPWACAMLPLKIIGARNHHVWSRSDAGLPGIDNMASANTRGRVPLTHTPPTRRTGRDRRYAASSAADGEVFPVEDVDFFNRAPWQQGGDDRAGARPKMRSTTIRRGFPTRPQSQRKTQRHRSLCAPPTSRRRIRTGVVRCEIHPVTRVLLAQIVKASTASGWEQRHSRDKLRRPTTARDSARRGGGMPHGRLG